MGFTVFVRGQVLQQWTAVHGVSGLEVIRNSGPVPTYPATFTKRIFADLSGLYDDDPTRRVELWEDGAGTADSATILTACPGLKPWCEERIRSHGAMLLATLAKPYTPEERETWGYQRDEALSWQKDPTVATPFCDIVAAGRGLSRESFMAKVLANCTAFYQASAAILGKQQRLIDHVWEESDVTSLLAIGWE